MVVSPRYKQLQQRLEAEIDEKAKIGLMAEMCTEVSIFDAEQAADIADDIIHRSKVVAYTPGIAAGLKLKGASHWARGEYDAGIEVLKVGLNIAVKIKSKELEAGILNYLGNIYRDQGDFANVLTSYKSALAIYEAIGDELAQSTVLVSISNLLYDLGDFDSALENALKCLPIFEQVNDTTNLASVCNTLGNIYFKKERFEEAIQFFQRNLEAAQQETLRYVTAESGLGKVYYKMQDFDNARKYLDNALQQAEHLGNVEVQIICHFYLGRLYLDKATYRQALQYLNRALGLATEYSRKHDLMSIHEMLSVLYDKTDDIPKASFHIKTYEKLKDEIFQQQIITELRNLQVKQQIELAQKEKDVAERTAQLKQQFMANMSHEIRTPMNAIVGMTNLLLAKDPMPSQMRYLKAIEISANNLLVIINDILDLSKIEAGKIEIEHVDFTLNDTLQSVQDMLLLKAEEKNIVLKLTTDAEIPNRLKGDPTRLNQVLINLAGNAVKFTDKGSVEIRTTLRKRDSKLRLQFDILDTGIGIAPEYVDHIFDSFTQAGTDVTRKFGGTGLGLTISKQITNLMGGEISVKSTVGQGTVFTVVIPFDEASRQEDIKKDNVLTPQVMQRLGSLKVLLAEDNEFNQVVAIETLRDRLPDLEIDVAANGMIAVQMCRAKAYDLVLMDVQMPVLDGVKATRMIRNELPAPARNVKIIAMTANVLQEDVRQYYDVGMNEYISKPFQVNELLQKINSLMEEQERPDEELAAIQDEPKTTDPITTTSIETPAATVTQLPVTVKPAGNTLRHPNKLSRREKNKMLSRQQQNVVVERTEPVEVAPVPEEIVAKQQPLTPVWEAPAKVEKPAIKLRQLPENVTDRAFLQQFTGGNTDKMRKYIGIFMDNAPKILDNLTSALDKEDYATIKISAHSLKPQLSYMGVKEEVSHVQQLERMAGDNPVYDQVKTEINDLKRVCEQAFGELKLLL